MGYLKRLPALVGPRTRKGLATSSRWSINISIVWLYNSADSMMLEMTRIDKDGV